MSRLQRSLSSESTGEFPNGSVISAVPASEPTRDVSLIAEQTKRLEASHTRIGRSVSERTVADVGTHIPADYSTRLPCHRRLKRLIEWRPIQLAFVAGILAYVVLLGVEVEQDRLLKTETRKKYLERLDAMLTFLFVVEIAAKLYVYGHRFLLQNNKAKSIDFYSVTEVVITGASIMYFMLLSSKTGREYKATIQFLKTLRIIRLVRVFTLKKELRVIVDGFVRSIMSLVWVFIVLLVMTYGCTVFCATYIGQKSYPEDPNFDNVELFGTVPRSMLTLFSMLILSEWDSVVRPIMSVQPMLVLFFVGFTIFVTFGMMNVVVGIIVDTVVSVRKKNEDDIVEQAKLRQIQRFEELMQETVDNFAKPMIGHEEPCFTEVDFVASVARLPEMKKLMDEIDFPLGFTANDLYVMLDNSGDNKVSKPEFVSGMSQLVFGTDFQHACLLQLSLHRVQKVVNKELIEMKASIGTLFDRVESLTKSKPEPPDSPPMGGQSKEQASSASNQQVEDNRLNQFLRSVQTESDTVEEAFDPLRSATLEHCRQEISKARVEIEQARSLQPSQVEMGLPPGYWAPDAASFSRVEELFLVRAKLLDAVYDASIEDLRKWLYHAENVGIDHSYLGLEMAYADQLVKESQGPWASSQRVVNALDRGEWTEACDLFIETCRVRSSGSDAVANMTSRLRSMRAADGSNVPALDARKDKDEGSDPFRPMHPSVKAGFAQRTVSFNLDEDQSPLMSGEASSSSQRGPPPQKVATRTGSRQSKKRDRPPSRERSPTQPETNDPPT